jgi:hypothetical protein
VLTDQEGDDDGRGYKKAELELTSEALYEQRQWLQVTLSSIGDAVITTDAEGWITFSTLSLSH